MILRVGNTKFFQIDHVASWLSCHALSSGRDGGRENNFVALIKIQLLIDKTNQDRFFGLPGGGREAD